MEVPYELAIKEYKSMFDNHTAKVFIETTDIIKLLRTKGRQVFVPSNWEGIKGVPPLKLKWKPTLPSSMKPRAIPINQWQAVHILKR